MQRSVYNLIQIRVSSNRFICGRRTKNWYLCRQQQHERYLCGCAGGGRIPSLSRTSYLRPIPRVVGFPPTRTRLVSNGVNPDALKYAIASLQRIYESKAADWPQQADKILQNLEQQNIQPNFECTLEAIRCWSKRKRKGSELRIDHLFQKLLEARSDPLTGNEKAQLQEAMVCVLNAYHHVNNAHRAEDILLQLAEIYPSGHIGDDNDDENDSKITTIEMCKLVLLTWTRSDSSRKATRAQSLLSVMIKDPGLPKPDINCYTLVLKCWASSPKENAPRRAELLLRSMEFSDDDEIRPNLLSYTCVLNAWSRSREASAPEHAERVLAEMKDTKGWTPDRVVYTAMISVWGRSDRKSSIEKAEAYFQQLQDAEATSSSFSEKEKMQATVVEYSALIQAWANHVLRNVVDSRRAADRVETLLEELTSKYHSSRFDGVANADNFKPNRMTFASVLRAIHASRNIPDRGERAKSVLQKMEALNLVPDNHILGLLEKCSKSASSKRRTRVAR